MAKGTARKPQKPREKPRAAAKKPARKPSRTTGGRATRPRTGDDESRPTQTLQVFQIVRRMRGRKYVYPRLTLEGGALTLLGLSAGDLVNVQCEEDEIRIRPVRGRRRR